MKKINQHNIIIYILCKNLNAITKCHLCVVFKSIKCIVYNYVKTLQNIGFNNFLK